MPRRHLRMTGAADCSLGAALRALRTELDLPGAFPPEVLAEAAEAARAPDLSAHEDATDLPFLTIDPPGSTDLDQAMHLERRPHGFRVHYAIADVAAFLRPGGALDAEAHRRVTTLYFPDGRIPLHPPVLSEGAASLLPGETRPAALWRIDLDGDGRAVHADVTRALVRSRAKLDYAGVQRQLDTDAAEEPLALLRDIGRLREEQEVARGGISLNVPEQEIVQQGGSYGLAYRATLPAEGWNAQISLLTGMAAARLMADTGTGILRTLPIAPDGAVARLRRSAHALRVDWPHHVPYAEVVRSLDPTRSNHAAFLQECTTLLRGAGYTAFDDGELPDPAVHAAVADLYTHCTAPLRRLVDRYASELCLAATAGTEPPAWVREALPALPKEMAEGTRRANTVERACVDLVEAALLEGRVGELFDAHVVDVQERDPAAGTVHLRDPAIVGRIEGGTAPLPLGERLRVRLTRAGPASKTVLFAPA
ncbi:RNB domain-containing ribonuclease [Streptomyces anulatus]|uniref:RNB domain-containing ribonuclease n=1 Tax=Streptomyces anulatus TaxID=1892 RepID=UPI002259EE10|nr:RNB domain-containing ribonuclease [Streptomyces anulatus]MCX4517928.1 RNB domain-containing ribonuclease [Streptomyces anulatus]MCX4600759.1 RNB domain-containing ribonuclease [Streptomyces anulatus]WSI77187.1 RNB domain-containing ribonuclease [Streptomyces anulatus]